MQDAVTLGLADNSEIKLTAMQLQPIHNVLQAACIETTVLQAQGNIGYGAAANLALRDAKQGIVLVLNPDVELSADALTAALTHLQQHPDCAMVTPVATDPNGQPLYLAKRMPDVFTLLLRGFAPVWLKRLFATRLQRYEHRETPFDQTIHDVQIASGCAMFLRASAWHAANGFDPRYFLYFEDFDLSLRLRAHGRIDRVGECRIVHAGGNASRKGVRHIAYFTRAMWQFFNQHGWR
jgi:hypothetical protein